jgi:UDPglucose 6-dehydrogenase
MMLDDDGELSAAKQQLLESHVTIATDCYSAARDAHAVAVLTEWDEFKSVDYERILRGMQRPAFVFDGRNILHHTELRRLGFEVHAIGKNFSA